MKFGKQNSYEDLSDEALVELAQSGKQEALEAVLDRYKNLVYLKTKSYFLAGADEDDLIQEGFIGLYKAVKSFNGKKFPYFKVFASLCVTRHILTAIKTAQRKKHSPLNSYISLDKDAYRNESDTTFIDVIARMESDDPETIVIDRENIDGIEYKINKALSKLELEVLVYYLRGQSYQEIADLLGKDVKSVDNAMQRAKKKLETVLNDQEVL